jgi:hypothetical protein
VIQVCAAGRTDQTWMMNVDTGNRTTSYTVVAASGRCLDLGTPQGSGGVTQWSSIVTNTCDGTPGQKWNAPPLTDEDGSHNLSIRSICKHPIGFRFHRNATSFGRLLVRRRRRC